jgi:hypothetical protein
MKTKIRPDSGTVVKPGSYMSKFAVLKWLSDRMMNSYAKAALVDHIAKDIRVAEGTELIEVEELRTFMIPTLLRAMECDVVTYVITNEEGR